MGKCVFLSYRILLWGSAADIEITFILQKRAVRSIFHPKPKDSLEKCLRKLTYQLNSSITVHLMKYYVRTKKLAFISKKE